MSPTYASWFAMKQRCLNPNHVKYPSYGGAGVTVCDEWRDFPAFLRDMGERLDGRTLDRIDGTKGYEPQNCRWATPAEQSEHIRTVSIVEYGGEMLPLPVLSRQLGVNKSTLAYRIARNWPQGHWGAEAHHGQRRSLVISAAGDVTA